jgi:hypothetical protein
VGSRRLRLPDFRTSVGGKFVSPKQRLPLLPNKYSWYTFLLEVESNPGLFGRKIP